jgi:hypothetical protein
MAAWQLVHARAPCCIISIIITTVVNIIIGPCCWPLPQRWEWQSLCHCPPAAPAVSGEAGEVVALWGPPGAWSACLSACLPAGLPA